jgi:hypothetical protein
MTDISTEKVCGFIVVRRPEYAETKVFKLNLQIDGKLYRGVDRLRWEDVELAYYQQRLPSALLPIWQEIERDSSDLLGLKLLKDYGKADEILRFSGDRSEMIAIWSPELETIKGTIRCDIRLNYLGLDCFSLGEWSVLPNGVYLRRNCFPEAISQLNQYGLFTSEAACDEVFKRYVDLASQGIL